MERVELGLALWDGPLPTEEAMLREIAPFQTTGQFPRWWGRMPEARNPTQPWLPEWVQDARGWPLLALWCSWRQSPSTVTVGLGPVEGGIELPQRQGLRRDFDTVRALPCRPVPQGLAADSAILAIPWFVLLSLGPVLRAIRRRRGLCPNCAYNLRGLPPGSPCPECGRPA